MHSIILFIYLISMSVADIWKRKISIVCSVVAAGLEIILRINAGQTAWYFWIGGLFLGCSIIIASHITKGAIGMGDGILFLVIGISLGFFETISLFLFSLFLSAVFSVLLILIHKVNRHHSFPFVPMVCLAYGGMILFE